MKILDQHFLEYSLEEYGREVISSNEGFISFAFYGDECHMADVFIAKEHRKNGTGKDLFAKMIERAMEEKSAFVSAIVAAAPERSEKATWMLNISIARGFQIVGAQNGHVIIKMNLNKGE